MRIIAQTDDGFLIDANRNEVANLIGFYWHGTQGCPQLKVGDEIKVSEMYDQLMRLSRNKEALHGMASNLREIADLLQVKQPVINRLIKAETASKEEKSA